MWPAAKWWVQHSFFGTLGSVRIARGGVADDAVLGALLELQRAERLAGSSCTLLSCACALCTAEPSDVAWCWEGLAGGEASHDGSDKAADKGSSAEQFELGFHACRGRLAVLLARLAELRCELLDLPLPLALDHVAQLLASEAGIAAGAGGADPLEERQVRLGYYCTSAGKKCAMPGCLCAPTFPHAP